MRALTPTTGGHELTLTEAEGPRPQETPRYVAGGFALEPFYRPVQRAEQRFLAAASGALLPAHRPRAGENIDVAELAAGVT